MGHEVGEWKEGAAAAGIAAEAKRLGKWIHMGRVNTQRSDRHVDADI
jgi:hypothetical protein